jgi:hypothetical protein
MHWLTIVIIPLDTADPEANVSEALAGSSAAPNKQFPEHLRRCHCIGWEAHRFGFDQVDNAPEFEELRQSISQARQEHNEELEKQLMWQRRVAAKDLERCHPTFEKPDVDCDSCCGSGSYLESRDPAGYWDYWKIGGGWDGALEPYNKGKWGSNDTLKRNCALVADLPESYSPAAIITPEGFWYETNAWLAAHEPDLQHLPEEKIEYERWEKVCRDIFSEYKDFLAVAVDCHN